MGLGAFAAAPHPNVVLIMTDDQGYADLGCHGNPLLRTPNLDRLHAQSVRLTDFHVTPLCTTTRAGLLTGRNSLRTGAWGVLGGHSLLRTNEFTLAEAFAAAGYRTGIFGKWHLGDSHPFRPQDRGFHEVVVHGGGGIGTTPDFWGNDYSDDTYWKNGVPTKFRGYSTDALFAEALKFIEANGGHPFFCYLPTPAPHDPYNVPERYSAPYHGKAPPETAKFFGMIANLDENVGRLRERLAALGLTENTLLIFLTDNGSSGGASVFNAGLRGAKGSPYEGGHRAPCFLHWPAGGLSGGRDVPQLTAQLDLFPTLIEWCGLRLPRRVAFDGLSLVPLLRGETNGWPDRIVIADTHHTETPVKWNNSAVMQGRWRLVNGRELHDLATDPGQKHNVAAQHPGRLAALRAAYEGWWAEIEPGLADAPHFVAGTSRENPLWLNAWDLHGQSVYMQHQVELGERADGWWAVEFAVAGDYEILLRRWPREVDRAIDEGLAVTRATKEGKKPVEIKGATLARVAVGGRDWTQPVPPGASEVVMRVAVPAGRTTLQAWFINDQTLGGATWGAYYVGIAKRSPANR